MRNSPAELERAWTLFNRHRIFQFALATQSAPELLITQLLAKMAKEQPDAPSSLFLRSAFDETTPRASWKTAVSALKTIEAQGSWGSKAKRDRLSSVAREPRLVGAFQAAAVGAQRVPPEYLAILAIDGSEASLDALLPHFHAAQKDPARLDELTKLSTFAKDIPALRALLAEAQRQLDGRQASGPSLTLAKQLGIAGTGRFRVHVRGTGPTKDETSFDLLLDSASPEDFRVWAYLKRRCTAFSAHELSSDELGAGRCELTELPQWLADLQRKLATRWRVDWTAYLRGKRLQLFLDWLLDPSAKRLG